MSDATYSPPIPQNRNAPKSPRGTIIRSYVQPADILYFEHDRAHAHLQPSQPRPTLKWLTQPIHGIRDIDTSELDWLLENGDITILAEDYTNPEHYFANAAHAHTDTRLVTPGGAPNTDTLTVQAERGKNQMKRINGFLKHPSVDYQHNTAVPATKFGLTAKYKDTDVAMAVLGRPTAKSHGDGSTIELSRFAAHPDRPQNTGSWLLSRAATWSYLEGYDQFLSYAGVMNDNEGVMYDAAGFEKQDESVIDGDRWESREGRTGHGQYKKRTWVKQLDPSATLPRRRCARSKTTMFEYTDTDLPVSGVSVSNLTLTREECSNRRSDPALQDEGEVAEFIETHAGPISDITGISAVFGARYEQTLIGVGVVSNGEGRSTDSFGDLEVTHLAINGASYPTQVGRWLLGKVRQWASLHGYSGLYASPGMAGTAEMYSGAGFRQVESDGGSTNTTEWRTS